MIFVFHVKIRNVESHQLEDRMESFFLAETTKYLYLLFDKDNFIHKNNAMKSNYKPKSDWDSETCFPGMSGYIFNTEAHPLDLAGIHCCEHKHKKSENSSVFLRSKLTGKSSCKSRPYHQKFFGLGSYVEDDELLYSSKDLSEKKP